MLGKFYDIGQTGEYGLSKQLRDICQYIPNKPILMIVSHGPIISTTNACKTMLTPKPTSIHRTALPVFARNRKAIAESPDPGRTETAHMRE
jgi:hypothetical protein